MNFVKEFQNLIALITTLGALVALIFTQISYSDKVYAKVESVQENRKSIQRNEDEINKMKNRQKKIDAILCGMAIDLSLPTAKAECKRLISN